MTYYVIADTHGFFSTIKTALEEAGFFKDGAAKLILLGDALDRGAEAKEMIDFLFSLHREGRLIFIRGNHEDLLVKCLGDITDGKIYHILADDTVHTVNGTFDTALQIASMTQNEAAAYPARLVNTVKQSLFYKQLIPSSVDYFETEHYVFTHGWIPVKLRGENACEYDPEWRNASVREWERARWYNGMEMACFAKCTVPDKTVVCGHFYTSWGHKNIHGKVSEEGSVPDTSPFYDDGIIAIDACTAYSGRVNVLKIED